MRTVALFALLGLAVAGCAGRDGTEPGPAGTAPSTAPSAAPSGSPATAAPGTPLPSSSATGRPPLSRTDLPTLKPPTRGPTPPSDQITGMWVLGTVTRGGDGPCYGLRTDDGRELALYGPRAGTLAAGDRIRARVSMVVRTIYCGPGEAMSLLETKRAR